MSCTQPNRMFDTGYKTKNGAPAYFFSPYGEHRQFIYKPISADKIQSQHPKHVYHDKIIDKFIEVPCGECESCKADKAKEWSFRCCAEASEWQFNWVINLTYNDENLPLCHVLDEETGEVLKQNVPTLKYKDVQDFKKRLQRHFNYHYGDENIRFLVAGEYGETYQRPHYHIIAFNFNCRDLVYHGKTKNGSNEYLSAEVQKLWNKGFVTIGDCNHQSIQYVANYTLKKIKGSLADQHYKGLGKCPEFIETSRKPGIGSNWFIKNIKDYIDYGKFIIGTNSNLIELHSCQFVDRMLKKDNPEELLRLKDAKKALNQSREEVRAMLSGVSVEQLRQTKAKEFHERIKHAKQHRKFSQYA